MLEFPHSLLREQVTDRPRLVGSARTGGRSASGAVTMSRADGGGLWAYGLQSIVITSADHVRLFEMTRELMAEGARPIIVPICNKRYMPALIIDGLINTVAPVISGGTTMGSTLTCTTGTWMSSSGPIYSFGCITHSDTTHFSDGACYAQSVVTAIVWEDALLRSTTIRIRIESGGELRGGELFSIEHATVGWRLYRVTGILDVQFGSFYRITIEPPLREGTAMNAHVEFDEPRCVMQLAEPAPLALEMRKRGHPSLSFVESFLPLD